MTHRTVNVEKKKTTLSVMYASKLHGFWHSVDRIIDIDSASLFRHIVVRYGKR